MNIDPLIAKVMVHAENRVAAAAKMKKVLSMTKLQGPPTNLDFLADVVASKRECVEPLFHTGD